MDTIKKGDGPAGEGSHADPVRAGRRVVTGFDHQGKSTILVDGPVPEGNVSRKKGKWTGHQTWLLWKVPADLNDPSDPMILRYSELEPPPGGVIARVVTYEPRFEYPMHETETLDIAFVISGKLELVLENGSTILYPGDCVIQRGTPHAWRVVGDEPCTFAGVMIDGEET